MSSYEMFEGGPDDHRPRLIGEVQVHPGGQVMGKYDLTVHIRNREEGRDNRTFYMSGAHEIHHISEPLIPVTPDSAPGHRMVFEAEAYDMESVKAKLPQFTGGPGDQLKYLLPSYSEREIAMMASAYLLSMEDEV